MPAERTKNSRSNAPDFERVKSMKIFIRHRGLISRHNHTYQKVKELFVSRYRQLRSTYLMAPRLEKSRSHGRPLMKARVVVLASLVVFSLALPCALPPAGAQG